MANYEQIVVYSPQDGRHTFKEDVGSCTDAYEGNLKMSIRDFLHLTGMLGSTFWKLSAEIPVSETARKNNVFFIIGKSIDDLYDEGVGAVENLTGAELAGWVEENTPKLDRLMTSAAALLKKWSKQLPCDTLSEWYGSLLRDDVMTQESCLVEETQRDVALMALKSVYEVLPIGDEKRGRVEALLQEKEWLDYEHSRLLDVREMLDNGHGGNDTAGFLSDLVDMCATVYFGGDLEELFYRFAVCQPNDLTDIFNGIIAGDAEIMHSALCGDLFDGLLGFLEKMREQCAEQLMIHKESIAGLIQKT